MIGWWRRRRARRDCFHHDRRTGESWIVTLGILDWGRKAYLCKTCDKVFIP